jgi:hypothetical protein
MKDIRVKLRELHPDDPWTMKEDLLEIADLLYDLSKRIDRLERIAEYQRSSYQAKKSG